MELYKIISSGKDIESVLLVSSKLIFAESFKDRLFGLIFKTIKMGQAFAIRDCNSIHTIWMRYKIDVIFLNKDNEIIKLYESLKQFRITAAVKDANCVIEFPEFTIKSFLLKKGDKLKIV